MRPLSRSQRDLLLTYRGAGSLAKTAEVLGRSQSTIRGRLHLIYVQLDAKNLQEAIRKMGSADRSEV